jgi:hypothetical protein
MKAGKILLPAKILQPEIPKISPMRIKMNDENSFKQSFEYLKYNMPKFERCRKRQLFSAQSGGQRQQSLLLFRAFVCFVSGGDVAAMMHAFFGSQEGAKLLPELSRMFDTPSTTQLVANIHQLHQQNHLTGTRSNVPLRLVANVIKRRQLQTLGWCVNAKAYSRARKPLKLRQLPPRCKPLSDSTRQLVQKFYANNSQPSGNKTVYDKNTKSHVPETCRSDSIKVPHKKFLLENPELSISYSCFWKLQPFHLRLIKRKLDMCEICVEASRMQKAFLQRYHVLESEEVATVTEGLEKDRASDVACVRGVHVCGVESCDCAVDKIGAKFDSPELQNELATFKQNMQLYKIHKKIHENQRLIFNGQSRMVREGEVVILADFKENLAVGGVGPGL